MGNEGRLVDIEFSDIRSGDLITIDGHHVKVLNDHGNGSFDIEDMNGSTWFLFDNPEYKYQRWEND